MVFYRINNVRKKNHDLVFIVAPLKILQQKNDSSLLRFRNLAMLLRSETERTERIEAKWAVRSRKSFWKFKEGVPGIIRE